MTTISYVWIFNAVVWAFGVAVFGGAPAPVFTRACAALVVLLGIVVFVTGVVA